MVNPPRGQYTLSFPLYGGRNGPRFRYTLIPDKWQMTWLVDQGHGKGKKGGHGDGALGVGTKHADLCISH